MDYRVSFETVSPSRLIRYSNADPMFFTNTKQVVPSSQIPEDDWCPIERVTTDVESARAQYAQLKAWADADTGFVPNVKIEQASPAWSPIDPTAPSSHAAGEGE